MANSTDGRRAGRGIAGQLENRLTGVRWTAGGGEQSDADAEALQAWHVEVLRLQHASMVDALSGRRLVSLFW